MSIHRYVCVALMLMACSPAKAGENTLVIRGDQDTHNAADIGLDGNDNLIVVEQEASLDSAMDELDQRQDRWRPQRWAVRKPV